MKRWFSDKTAAGLFFSLFFIGFICLPLYLWSLGRRKWSLVVGFIWVGIGVFLYGAWQAIFN